MAVDECDWIWVGVTGCGWVVKMVKSIRNLFLFFVVAVIVDVRYLTKNSSSRETRLIIRSL